ncbi:MAG: hypothetical protein ACI9LY_002404 [Arenicella sp.]|jgi:hypothetical protein
MAKLRIMLNNTICETERHKSKGEILKRVLFKIMIPVCLTISAGNTYANSATDYFLQNDMATMGPQSAEGISDQYQDYQNYIDWLLAEGYSPTSIMMSSVGRGVTLADIVFMMSRARPENADKYYYTAERLLPNLPGWVCSTANAMGHRYDHQLGRDSLDKSKTLARVADLYFYENERFVNTPDWRNKIGHVKLSVRELIEYKQIEIRQKGDMKSEPVESWWYLKSKDSNFDVVTVGLYPDQRRVVIDARLIDLQALERRGVTQVPVMFMYNDNGHIPISDIERVSGELFGGSEMKGNHIDYIDYADGEITASEVISRFDSDGKRIPPVRDWRIGDHHLMVRTEELVTLFDIPEKRDINPAEWQKAVNRLEQQSQKPLQISLLADSDSERFISSTVLVSVAREMGLRRLPVIFFYHRIERQPSGMPSACLPDIKAAAEAGSASLTISSTKIPSSVPPVIIPPVVGPISPN